MRIDVSRLGDADVVRVEGMLDLSAAARLAAVLDGRLAQGRSHLVVDLLDVRTFDVRAAGMFATLVGRAATAGGAVTAVATAGRCHEVLAIVGRDRRLGVVEDRAPVLERYPVPAGESTMDDARWPGGHDITVDALLAGMTRLDVDSPERAQLRQQAIEDAMPLARRLARRFRDRGEPGEDLTQVAMVGLVNAIDGFDPARGSEFAGYATPTITGELRRYFRDKGWRIRVPRRLQELCLQVKRAIADLSQTRAGTPTVAEIATHLSVAEAEVAEAIEVSSLYQPLSLSTPVGPEEDLELTDPLGQDDPAMAVVEQRESVRPLLRTLPERQRAILRMRYFGDMTQAQIADHLGISQMHVSRLLSRTLDSLRAALADAA